MTTATAPAAAPAAAPAPAVSAAPVAAPAAAPAVAAPAPVAQAPAAAPAAPVEGLGPDGKPVVAEPQVPEKYEFTAPEGIELEATGVEEFTAIAKDLKLSQADAQRLADVATKVQQRQLEAHATTVKGWVESCKTDKEFGGDALGENLAIAQKAIETFGTPALKDLLDQTGLGNHPEVARAFFKAGKAISEGKFIASGARTATPAATTAQALYPGMNP